MPNHPAINACQSKDISNLSQEKNNTYNSTLRFHPVQRPIEKDEVPPNTFLLISF